MLQIVHTQLRETRVESVAPDSKLQGVDNTGSRHGHVFHSRVFSRPNCFVL